MEHLFGVLPHTRSAGVQLWALETSMRPITLAILCLYALPLPAKEREGVTVRRRTHPIRERRMVK